MTRRLIRMIPLVLVGALLPAATFAQRSGTRSEATSGSRRDSKRGPTMRAPSTREIEELNPAWLMGDKRRKLSLSDSQVTQFKALEEKIKERNKTLLTEYDSIRRDFHAPTGNIARVAPGSEPQIGGPTDREMEKAMQQMRVMHYIITQIADRRKQDVDETLALLKDDAQKKKALDLLKDQDDDLAKLLPKNGPPPGGAL